MWKLDVSSHGVQRGEPVALSMGLGIRSLGFSADGKKVAYSRGRRVANIWRVPRGLARLATWDDLEQVTFDQTLIEMIDIKPDGSQMLFDSDRSGNPDLWIKDFTTGQLTQITAHPAADWAGRFSPDGDQIVFYSLRSGNRDVWVTAVGGGTPRRLTDFPGEDINPSWSPDGTQITYVSLRPSYDLYTVPSRGGEPVAIHATRARTTSSDWAFDGQSLIFHQDSRVWRVPIDGGSPEALTDPGVSGTMLRQARDSNDVYMIGHAESENSLLRIRVEERTSHVIAKLTGRRGSIGWTGLAMDREFVYFTWQDDLGDVWVMDVVTEASE
jgi:Tol biopolymer transport system component